MLSWSIVISLLLWLGEAQGLCEDIDTIACERMARQQDVCSDSVLANTACPRFCKLCPIECYYCNTTVEDYHLCNTTSVCAEGQVCMLKELRSIFDGHHEYELTCAEKEVCDGNDLSFMFNKRGLEARDVSATCCFDDLCNYPEMTSTTLPTTTETSAVTTVPITISNMTEILTNAMSTSTMPTTTSSIVTTTTSNAATCLVDLIFVVDESTRMDEASVKSFLTKIVQALPVSADGVHVSLGLFTSTAHEEFNLNDHSTESSLLSAISHVHFRGGTGDLSAGLSYAVNDAMTPAAGDRPDVDNVVVIVTADGSHSFQLQSLEHRIHTMSDNIVLLEVGRVSVSHLATDAGHELKLTPRSLDTPDTIDTVTRLICEY